MRRWVAIANGLGLSTALLLSLFSGVRSKQGDAAETTDSASPSDSEFPLRDTRGVPEIRDKSGAWLELIDYRRIASGSTIADELLLEFCEPDRIVSFTAFSQKNEATAHRYASKPRLSALDDLETLILLEPDLLLLNTLGSETRVARLRELGIRVFDLGEMRGVRSFLANARAISTIVGRPELGRRYEEDFLRRLERVAGEVDLATRPRAAYLSVFGTSIYGGGRNTSYDDVLHYAGLSNALGRSHEGWPDLSVEEVLALDPELVVTPKGMGDALCSLSELDRLSVCKGNERSIIELPASLLSDPGSGMLRASEKIRAAATALRARQGL